VAPAGLDVEGDVRLAGQQELLEGLGRVHVDVVGTPCPEPELRELHVPVTFPRIVASCCPEALAGICGTELTPWALRSAAAERQVC
jgi:hypothetical protein